MDLEADPRLELVKEYDPQGNRTVGVLTKIDLMNAGSDVSRYLANAVPADLQLRHGYFAVLPRACRGRRRRSPTASASRRLTSRSTRRTPRRSSCASASACRCASSRASSPTTCASTSPRPARDPRARRRARAGARDARPPARPRRRAAARSLPPRLAPRLPCSDSRARPRRPARRRVEGVAVADPPRHLRRDSVGRSPRSAPTSRRARSDFLCAAGVTWVTPHTSPPTSLPHPSHI